jgi:LPS export ABC transporter protein LptC/lipopolysaccharide transport protein LptA
MTDVRRRFTIIKWIPRLLLVGVIAFSVYIGWTYRGIEQKKSKTKIEKTNVKGQQSNIDYSHFDKGKLIYKVNADTVLTMKSDQQQLSNPEFIFYDEKQKEAIRVTGKRCNISRDFNQITVIEDTFVKSAEGMQVAAHMIRYDAKSQTFSTPGVAHFKWRSMKGKSKGFTYDIPNEELELPERPEITYVNLAGQNRKPIEMTGDHGYIDRKSGFAYFEGSVEVTQGKDLIKAHRLEAAFKPGSNDLEKLTAVKNVRIQFGKPGGKNNQEQPAPDKQPAVAPASSSAPSMSNVFTADTESGKDLSAEFVEMFFYEDGNTISNFHSTGDCTFILHTFDKKNLPKENRIIKGEEFHAKFDRNGDMEEFRANQKVSVKLQPLDSPKRQQIAASQTIFCDDLYAQLVPETGDVKEIQFNDSFKHVQGARTVTSQKALYIGEKRKTDLIGEPEIVDASFNITANDMELFEETSGIHAKGNVKSAFIKTDGKTPTTFPFSSPSSNPVYISSEDMVWDSQKSEATYTEKAKLWQDKNVITAGRLVINDRDKTLSAYDKVHTIFYNNKKEEEGAEEKKEDKKEKNQTKPAAQTSSKVEPVALKKEQKKTEADTKATTQTQPEEKEEPTKLFGDDSSSNTGPISVDAGIMNYVEKDRIIHFEKDVKIVTEATKINSDKADFYLKPETSELDRLYAQGKVTINHEQKRGSGTTATFYTKDHKLVLEGSPRLSETGKADIVGRMLTLFLTDDRILIDGQEDGRATTTLQMTGEYSPSSKSTDEVKDESGSDTKDALDAGSKKKKKSKKRKSN